MVKLCIYVTLPLAWHPYLPFTGLSAYTILQPDVSGNVCRKAEARCEEYSQSQDMCMQVERAPTLVSQGRRTSPGASALQRSRQVHPHAWLTVLETCSIVLVMTSAREAHQPP